MASSGSTGDVVASADQLKMSFGGRTLFDRITFSIHDNEKIGLIGPNGAGKSTLVKLMCQKLEPEKGNIAWKKGCRIGYLEQTPTFEKDKNLLDSVMSDNPDSDEIARAYEWLAKLDLLSMGEDVLASTLSGGWQKRLALARELVKEPDVLFLDEPTNHLDIESIIWLEEFLRTQVRTLVLVTHDRLFLQRVADRILDLDPKWPQGLFSHSGDYVTFCEIKAQQLEAQKKQEQVLKNTLRRETEWLRRGAKARQTKQKARIDAAHELSAEVKAVSDRNRVADMDIQFGDPKKNPKRLIELIGVSGGYQGKTLFENLDLFIGPKTRLALRGRNGCGKSTLLKIINGEVEPLSGQVKRADQLKTLYFEQSRDRLNPQLSLLKNICPEGDFVNDKGQPIHVRSYLDKFKFRREQLDLPVHKLSGGEQARLRLAQLMLLDSQVLILDEPTNDLDLETLEVLEESLAEFHGAILLVTHDRYFMDSVSNEMLSFDEDFDQQPFLQKFANYFQWENWRDTAAKESSKSRSNRKASENNLSTTESSTPTPAAAPVVAPVKNKIKMSFKEKFDLENIESWIAEKEQTIESLKKDLSSSESLSNSTRLMELSSKLQTAESELQKLYDRWTELNEKFSTSN